MTKAQVKTYLSSAQTNMNQANATFVYSALMGMYARQTMDEKASGSTRNQNGLGFGHSDAAFLSSVAERSKRYGTLTPRQTTAVAKALSKYSGQIAEFMPDSVQESASEPAAPVAEVEAYNGTAFRVSPLNDGRYSVTLYDTDADMSLDTAQVYPTRADAEAMANTLAARSFPKPAMNANTPQMRLF